MADLKKKREDLQASLSLRERGDKAEDLVQVRVAMATCGIAAGAKQVMDFLIKDLDEKKIPAVVTQTGCMGYCYAEPTIEVKKPGKDPIVFGYVNEQRAKEIVDKYILGNELVEGIIPVNYEKIEK